MKALINFVFILNITMKIYKKNHSLFYHSNKVSNKNIDTPIILNYIILSFSYI